MILPYIPKEYDQLTFTNALTGINDQLDNIQTSIDAINSSSNSTTTTSSVSANDPVVLGILNQINTLGTSLQSLFDSLAAYANKYGASIQTWQTTLQTTSESFARKISVVTAGLNGNTAGIMDIQSALVDLRSSTAEQINLLQSTFNQSVSTISTTLTTLATNDSAISSTVTTLSAQVNNPTTGLAATAANVSAESTARASADSAISSTVSTLSASVISRPNLCPDVDQWIPAGYGMAVSINGWGNVMTSNTSGNGTLMLASTPNIPCFATQPYVISGDSLLFTTNPAEDHVYFDLQFYNGSGTLLLDGPQSDLYGYHNFSMDNSHRSAIAIQVTAPSGSNYMVGRFVMVASGTITSVGFRMPKIEQGTLPATTYSPEGQINTNSASIINEASARASGDSAISSTVTTLSAQVNNPTTGLPKTRADLSTEISTRASADSAISSTVSTLSTTVSGHTTTLSTYGSSINGLQALYGVKLDVNGYVSGFVMNNGSNYSTFKINADDFEIIKPGATSATFQVEGGQVKINGQLLISGSTGTTQISTGAVTGIASAYTAGTLLNSDGSTLTAQSVNYTNVTGNVLIQFCCTINGTIPTELQPSPNLFIVIDSTTIYQCPCLFTVTGSTINVSGQLTFSTLLPGGANSFYLNIQTTCSNRSLTIIELKR